MKILHLASAANLGYFPGLEVLVASTLLSTGRDHAVHFHVIDGGIPDSHWDKLRQAADALHPHVTIHRLAFSDAPFAGFPGMHGSKMPYARLLLGELLPHVEKLLYLDSDILVTRDLAPLFDWDLNGKTAAAAADPTVKNLDEDCPWLPAETSRRYGYFNSGVMLLDLSRWRELRYAEQCIAAIAEHPHACRYWDQTALNYLLRDDHETLPPAFNWYCRTFDELPREPANLHFCGAKPWVVEMARFDHHLWRNFYRDVIGDPAPWPRPASIIGRILDRWSRHAPSRWMFFLAMRALISLSRHAHQRETRELALAFGREARRKIRPTRQWWKKRLAQAETRGSR